MALLGHRTSKGLNHYALDLIFKRLLVMQANDWVHVYFNNKFYQTGWLLVVQWVSDHDWHLYGENGKSCCNTCEAFLLPRLSYDACPKDVGVLIYTKFNHLQVKYLGLKKRNNDGKRNDGCTERRFCHAVTHSRETLNLPKWIDHYTCILWAVSKSFIKKYTNSLKTITRRR